MIPASAALSEAMAAFEGPILSAINGYAVTAGFEMALACDFLIASTEAKFADTHARVGMMPGWGLSQRLPRLIGHSHALDLISRMPYPILRLKQGHITETGGIPEA